MQKIIRMLSVIAIALVLFGGILGLTDIRVSAVDAQEPVFSGAATKTSEEVTPYVPGDVTGDGKVTVADLIRLSQYLAGWDVELYPKEPVYPVCGHIEGIDAAVAPTCVTAGKTEGKSCVRCGEVIVAQTEIPATGEHTYGTDGKCIHCGVAETTCAEHTFGETSVITRSTAFQKGEGKKVCTVCGLEAKVELPTSIKILAVGNSFSVDAMQYLYDILDDAGVEEIALGNLYIGGCSLDTHYSNIKANLSAYTYYTNKTGTWQSVTSTVSSAIADEDWDVITVQQVSQDSGRPQTFGNLNNILKYITDKAPEHSKIYWHMTWAYQNTSSHSGFANYGNDQMVMYNAIVGTTRNPVMRNEYIEGIIPTGTAIQNLRTSFVGDTLTRDGYHMTYAEGRYTAALTWFAYLTGGDPASIKWVPTGDNSIPEKNLAPIREAVKNAIETPFEVTESTMKPVIVEKPTREALTDDDKARLKAGGYDPEKFEALVLDETILAYYNSTNNGPSSLITNQNNSKNFYATKIFTKEELPVGSVITIKSGYQYRPEGWTALGTKNAPSARPGNVSTSLVEVTNTWWGSFNYRAFNVSGTTTIVVSEKDVGALRIYVPKAAK